MNLTVSIESAELCFKQIIEDFFVSVYDRNNLISHGIDHHRRVWFYAKEIVHIQGRQNISESIDPSKLIIACYLHDIGMSQEPGPYHGNKSRELCIQFMNKNGLDENKYDDVLEAIENHDRKDYTEKSGSPALLSILSVADDLDAFGYTGIFRYSEIYLTRGISPGDIGHRTRENAGRRFDNFQKIFGNESSFARHHKRRYDILDNFFIHYNKQAVSYLFEEGDPEGYCGVIQLFRLLIRHKMALTDFFLSAEMYQDDIIIDSFLKGWKSELQFC